MDEKIEDLITGVMMDGTEFSFEALCLSITKIRMTRMVVRWMHAQMKKLYPDQENFTDEQYEAFFAKHNSDIEDMIRKRYPTVKRHTEASLRYTFSEKPSLIS